VDAERSLVSARISSRDIFEAEKTGGAVSSRSSINLVCIVKMWVGGSVGWLIGLED
jgi:hypothetical protein